MKVFKSIMPEISLRMKPSSLQKARISSSRDAASLFRELFDTETIGLFESFQVIFTNRANNSIGYMQVSRGGVSGTVVDPRIIMKAAIDCCASGILMCHNHPSGNLKPSQSDIDLTRKLKECTKLFEMQLLDHIILAPREESFPAVSESTTLHPGQYYSFADEGII